MSSCFLTKPAESSRGWDRSGVLSRAAVAAAFWLVSGALLAQDLPVAVGDKYEAAVAALRKKAIAFQEKTTPAGTPTQSTITYEKGEDRVSLDFTLWPDRPTASERAYTPAGAPGVPRHRTLTHIRIVGHNSEAARRWRESMRREPSKNWVYFRPGADPRTGDAKLYPTAGYMQWIRPHPDPKRGAVPWVTFVFQAKRPPRTPAGTEPTILDIFLENPYKPRIF